VRGGRGGEKYKGNNGFICCSLVVVILVNKHGQFQPTKGSSNPSLL
jgi:hypothetical protein